MTRDTEPVAKTSNVKVVEPSERPPYWFTPRAVSDTDIGEVSETRSELETSFAAASETRSLETWSVVKTAPAVATDRMLAHNCDSAGSHDHVSSMVPSGTAA